MRLLAGVSALLLTLVAACGCQQTPHQPSERERFAAMAARTVKIDSLCADGSGWGSGVILEDTKEGSLIATANHVARKGCVATFKGARLVPVARDLEHDVLLLRLASHAGLAPLQEANPYLGMRVVITGYPTQWPFHTAAYQVTRGSLIVQDRVSASTWFGGSGGPVWDEQGNLVGLVDAVRAPRMVPTVDQFYIVSAHWVFKLERRAGV